MAPPLPLDFREFLKLLNDRQVEYLVVGGVAVGFHGYPRATGDLDVWIAVQSENAARIAGALRSFGFDLPSVQPELFLQKGKIMRMGFPPLRIEVHTSLSGVEFQECYSRRIQTRVDGIDIPMIHLRDLRANKMASGRPKDQDDLQHLPPV